MNSTTGRRVALFEVISMSIFIEWYIWRLQFTPWKSWLIFPVGLAASFLLHGDPPRTLGWRVDNLGAATKQAAVAFAAMAAGLVGIGFALGAPPRLPPNLASVDRLWSYFAFCLLQQVALNSFLNNRVLSLVSNRLTSSLLTGALFAVCHWPNPVLVPLTFVGGSVMAWLFARQRNIIPLALLQALLGSLAWWSFPVAWHHHLRVGPGYYLG